MIEVSNEQGLKIAKQLKAFLLSEGVEVKDIFRNENDLGYGDDSAVLTVLHEEGEHKAFFDMDYCYAFRRGSPEEVYEPFEKMLEFSSGAGFRVECCSTYVSTVYID